MFLKTVPLRLRPYCPRVPHFPQLTTLRHNSTFPLQTDEEKNIYNKLKQNFQNPKELLVQDISGGCGSMYKIIIQSAEFNTLTMIKQHKLVNSILKDDIKKWHGLQLTTKKDL
ncbi:BolA-like protein 3 [Hanseniaspora osmophila]|uniref:Altered inheritance of mitochondria protein 1 n=1 Tax=Hanseniaspora osmophila TaxID=56408 RepID=A0A1E5S065_9ASCO|nr:Altered inheritance of mitochondria protein 1 [Hanseniaspora osmophila]